LSSILKALKKLEAEKARSQGAQVDLTRDILRPAEPRRSSPLKLPLLILALILFGGVVGIAFVSWFDRPDSSSISSEPVSSPADRVPTPSPPPSAVPVPPTQPGPVSRSDRPQAAGLEPARPVTPPDVVEPTSPHLVAHPSLVVSGVVYQTDPASRIAIVNDLPAMAGTMVEGAMIEEIRQGSVVFSYQGERFEISIGE